MASARKKKGKDSEAVPKKKFNEKVAGVLEFPKEVVLDVPKLTMVGNQNIVIENFKGIIEYDDNKIRINSNVGVIKITGKRLLIRGITSEDVVVEGDINNLEFSK